MDTRSITPARLAESVIAVPPLARDAKLRVNLAENRKIAQFIEGGGVNTLLYGGNAVFYHVRLSEYEQVLQTLVEIASQDTLIVPAVGPTYGTMMDQAEVLKDFDFPTVMVLPQREIADANGIANGIRRFVDAYGKPIVLYLKHDQWLPADLVGKMHRNGIISWIKYAVVREDTSNDNYLRDVLAEVPSNIVVSGIGEQPAIIHMRDFEIANFTSGCVCVNPALSMKMMRAIQSQDFDTAETIRQQFTGLENLRNGINPIRVLHRAVELAGIAETGPMFPLLSEIDPAQTTLVANAAEQLRMLTA
ncbi:dihydrodipicolinate synthase family protein [Aureliella helgolandensis]|uniref:5-dehydro-4-deoxyglucarate dehydratase n=1 Tax=Aureliella helgolandensis TaxID=2527968 RepID=A0A518G8P3_9BACT|nr:dihydrodipicolinate synthase family protein [Aureliella helgolandensis]QDV24966.1 5-dehydro-4-deoxyglucarate dehydratase [Aureliella helgolandensis]